ncbi:MAG: 4Fe-4S dicluster domain-containing protein [candidate division WOR-3 bacterium]|nr:4Fe-4S dicluster domain-containing protein [candidate division WOR-3 bacterium]
MPKVIYDYNKCTGEAECADACPVDILESSENGRWCKPVDDEVENKDELDKYYKEVEPNDSSDLTLEFEMPSCIECQACVSSCPEDAIKIESD